MNLQQFWFTVYFIYQSLKVVAMIRSMKMKHEYIFSGRISAVKSSSGGINFVTPTANFCLHLLAGLILPDIKKFQKHTLHQIFFSFDVALCEKVLSMMFFEDF
jgi:hypothetical protein